MAYTIRKILSENWHNYLKTHKPEDYQIKEVEKAINCNRHGCNSRICSSCGKRHTDDWSDKLKDFILPHEHKHLLLTVPATLRSIFKDWSNLKLLMDSSRTFLKDIYT
ncbi:MAG: transposase zinc-binding domain-containing protein [Nanoarchaeota archaeon]|nr:transposase zinc-binding domain-containing protein [Nanoarchaeota archaeon]